MRADERVGRAEPALVASRPAGLRRAAPGPPAEGSHASLAGMNEGKRAPERGPFRAEQLADGDRYELSNGHPIFCAPSGGRHGGSNLTGGLPLATDPLVAQAGIDVGFSP